MHEEQLERGAQKLVEVNGRVQAGEKVVVVTDTALTAMADRVARAAGARGAEIATCIMQPRDHDGQEPPEPVASAMSEASVLFTPVSKSITHTSAMKAALARGARAILMTAYTDEVLSSPALLETDFSAQQDVCRRLGEVFTHGSVLRLSSPQGTELRFSIEGRVANVLTCIPGPGELAPVPTIEVNVVPGEGTAEGRVVIDASVPYLGIGVLRDPMVCTVEKGFITRIEGGDQARDLSRDLESHGDPNCFNLAELGVGLNPNARLTGRMLDDEGVLGTIHLGIGTSITLGGGIKAPTHYDLLMWDPVIEVDRHLIQEGSRILA